MKKSILTYFLLVFGFCYSYGQSVILEGIYNGKKIYVKNSGSSGQGNCTEKIVINNKEVPFKDASAYAINPDSLGFNLGDTLKITIYHKPDCKPSIITDNSTPRSSFQITSLTIDKSGLLKWVAKEKTNKNPFVVQQFINYKWTKIGEVESKGDKKENEYSFKISSELENFEFRIMQISELGQIKCSKSIKVSP